MTKQITLKILRYNPETDVKPSWQEFVDLPYDNSTSVLDMLAYIKAHFAPDLSFRSSCRMAICGSCGVMINNVPKLLCKTFLRDYTDKIIAIRPLAHFPIERDLVVNMTHFMQSIEAIKPYIISKQQTNDELSKKIPALMMKYQQFNQCINCGLCYAACPQFGLNPEFIGPAAIALAMRYILDSDDEGKNERMPILNQEDGVWRCTFVGYCSTVCPKQVDPASAIQLGKIESAKDYLIAKFKLNKD